MLKNLLGCIALILFGNIIPLKAQQINLDKVVRAGELTLFQELRNEKAYYYIIDKPRIATDENGTPKFSFLRYVQNVRSGASEEEAREGEGGGIVHALVELGVTNEQLKDAEKELQRVAPGAVIKGPAIFKEGTIALVSSFAKADGELTKQVIGLGKAPLLDGQRAAVSVQLTKMGSKILWESFQTPTPDFSISFEMVLTGYRSPKRALIEADFEQIYEHKNFQAAVAAPVLAAEIKMAFDDLTKKGAIKVTQIGEDQNLEKIMEAAYNKILKMMFEPAGGTGTPSLGSLTSLAQPNQPSLLDRATRMLSTARTEARTENRRQEANERASNEFHRNITRSRPQRSATGGSSSGSGGNTSRDTGDLSADERRTLDAAIENTGEQREFTPPRRISHEQANQQEERQRQRDQQSAQRGNRETVPSFAIAASFEMKKIRQRGKFTIDLNKYTTDNMTVRFDRNFGNINCRDCFRQVNLDDPLFKQRELVAFVDGTNATDFGEYINFVTLAMKKTHESGDITLDEVRIDRNNFSKEGNNFKLLYGWKGDNNRNEWLNYEYKTSWSFFGGITIENEWLDNDEGAIALAPPYLKKQIDIEADPEIIKEKGVRFIEVKLYYKVGEENRMAEAKMNIAKGEFSKQAEIFLPRDNSDYEYEITWHIKGAGTKSTERLKGNSSILFADDL